MIESKIGVVIQGPWMAGVTDKVITFFTGKVDYVIYSGWENDQSNAITNDSYIALFNKRPLNAGLQNRNLQRVSTYYGLTALSTLKVKYALKWRSDILPREVNFSSLIRECGISPFPPFMSRLVMSAYRAYPINADWLSTIPDLYMFGVIDHMLTMWSIDDLSMEAPYNIPKLMMIEMSDSAVGTRQFFDYMYNSHAELYSVYKERLLVRLNVTNIHATKIFKQQFFFDDYLRYKFDWFDSKKKLRSVEKSNFPKIIPSFYILNGNLITPLLPTYDIRLWYRTTPLERLKNYVVLKTNLVLPSIRKLVWILRDL